MDEGSLHHFLRCQYQLYEVPIRVYQGGRLVMRFDNYSLGIHEPARDAVVLRTMTEEVTQRPVYFNIQKALMMEGAVFDQNSDAIIYVGLARAVRITEQIARRYLLDMGVNTLPKETILQFHGYMNSLPIVAPGLFAVILSSINTVVNNSVIEPRNIFEDNVEPGTDLGINKKMLSQREERYFGGKNNTNAQDLENRFLFCVRHGMVGELKKLCNQTAGFSLYGDAANPDAWRITKDRCIVAVALVSRTAIAAGLPAIEGAQLCDLYIQRAELCKTGKSLNQVRYDMLMDFTERVKELQLQAVENQLIRSVSDYILEHLEEKVTLADLADRFSVNKNYLCGMFKEEMGTGIIEYANRHKINMAKQMLRFTNKPLVEISSYLNFCSQSYFQKVFKQVTGMTPTAYRNSEEI